DFVESQTAFILERCTECGKCVEVCPQLGQLPIQDEEPALVTTGIIGLLRSDQPTNPASIFVNACSGSALCRDVCPEGIDPYTMMRLAKLRQSVLAGRRTPPSDYALVDLSMKAQIGPAEPRWFTRRPP